MTQKICQKIDSRERVANETSKLLHDMNGMTKFCSELLRAEGLFTIDDLSLCHISHAANDMSFAFLLEKLSSDCHTPTVKVCQSLNCILQFLKLSL